VNGDTQPKDNGGSIIVVGVMPHQGDRENLSQGEASQVEHLMKVRKE
jgi:hypothetical protein